jgi:hypothetical protein
MTGTCEYAASVARETATKDGSAEFQQLSSMMCWDAVAHVALLAGIVDQSKYKSLMGSGHVKLVRTSDPAIDNAAAMKNVPEGHILGFFSDGEMIHAMLSTGGGMAAGNKNDCVGQTFASVGWQNLDLRTGLNWGAGNVNAPKGVTPGGEMLTRSVTVHHRAITGLTMES